MNEDPKRRDDRRQKVMTIIDDCLQRGVVLDEVEVDGMRLHIASMPVPKTATDAPESVDESAPLHPVSYRLQAREALMKRRSERTSS